MAFMQRATEFCPQMWIRMHILLCASGQDCVYKNLYHTLLHSIFKNANAQGGVRVANHAYVGTEIFA